MVTENRTFFDLLLEMGLIYVRALFNNLVNFRAEAHKPEVLFGEGNKVKTVMWLRRIAHFQAIVGHGLSYLCGQNFESLISEGPV